MEQPPKACNKNVKSESRKSASSHPTFKKQSRNGKIPTRLALTTHNSSDFVSSTTWICKNLACKAVLFIDDSFCQRCSCCICHQFDDNKDPSLWLVCESESGQGDSCGSCHIKCAFQQERLGVLKLGQSMRLDGSYCCATCGKVSGILGCWKKQVSKAEDARRVDVLYYRIHLTYRLLDGTSKFKDLHDIITEAKTKLEAEMAPMKGNSLEAATLVNRLDASKDVKELCSLAIVKANELLANNCKGDSLPAACGFQFEEITCESIEIVLIEIPTPSDDSVIGYKLWYRKSKEEIYTKEPPSVFTREKRRISVTNLQPCTEYSFRIISYTEAGDLGHSEATCYTKSADVFKKHRRSTGLKMDNPSSEDHPNSTLGVSCFNSKVREIGNNLELASNQKQGHLEGSAVVEQCCGVTKNDISPEIRQSPPVTCEFNLKVVSVPDSNEDFTQPLESSRDEDNGWTMEHADGLDTAAASYGVEKNGLGLAKSNDSGPSDESRALVPTQNEDVCFVDSLADEHWNSASGVNDENPGNDSGGSCSRFKVQDLGKILPLAWAQEQGRLEGSPDVERFRELTTYDVSADIHQPPAVSHELGLNLVSVPDLNEVLNPPLEYSRNEDNGWTLEPAAGPDDDAAFHGVEKNGLVLAKSNGRGPSDDSQAWVPNWNRDVPAVDPLAETHLKRSLDVPAVDPLAETHLKRALDVPAVDPLAETHLKRALTVTEEIPDNDNALLNGSPVRVSTKPGTLGENLDYGVRSFCILERQGHIKQDFRLKFLTWFSLSSTEQECQVVYTFLQELKDDPNILAGQLVDAFGDRVSSKRPRV